MEFLDDDIVQSSTPKLSLASVDRISDIIAKSKAYLNDTKGARTAIGIVSFLTLISLFRFAGGRDGGSLMVELVVTVVTMLLFVFVALYNGNKMHWSLLVAGILYGLEFILMFFTFEPVMLIFGVFIRSAILYFIVKGTISAFKLKDLEAELKSIGSTRSLYD